MQPSGTSKVSNPGGQNEVAILRSIIERDETIAVIMRSGRRIVGKVIWSDIHNIALSGVETTGDHRVEDGTNIVIPKSAIDLWAYGAV